MKLVYGECAAEFLECASKCDQDDMMCVSTCLRLSDQCLEGKFTHISEYFEQIFSPMGPHGVQ